jgi:hypothetical protein
MMGSMNENLDNGNLDLGKLMGAMSGIVENVKGEIEKSDDPMLKSMMSMIQLPQMPTPDESHPLLTDNSLGKESDNSLGKESDNSLGKESDNSL